MLDITPQKRRHSSTGSEVSGNEWIASSSKAGTTALTREDYGFTGTTPDGNNFTIYFNTLQRSRLLYDIYTEQEEECLVPVCTSQFLAWVNYVQLGPNGFGADDLSGYITIKSITDALRVRIFDVTCMTCEHTAAASPSCAARFTPSHGNPWAMRKNGSFQGAIVFGEICAVIPSVVVRVEVGPHVARAWSGFSIIRPLSIDAYSVYNNIRI